MSTKTTPQNISDASAATQAAPKVDVRSNPLLGASFGEVPKRTGARYYDQLLWKLCKPIEEAQGAGFLLGLTGCDPRTDSSILAANLAIRAADQGMAPVLLIDANRRSPRLHQHMRTSTQAGLADVLAGRETLQNCVHPTSTEGLHLLSIGTDQLWDFTSVVQQQYAGLLNELREAYLLVIIHLPAAGEMNHALPLAPELDAALLVVRSERIDRRAAQAASRSLQDDGVNVVGAVMTDQRQYLPRWVKRWL